MPYYPLWLSPDSAEEFNNRLSDSSTPTRASVYKAASPYHDIINFTITPWVSKRKLEMAGFHKMELDRPPLPTYNNLAVLKFRAISPTYKVLWDWLHTVFFSDTLPPGVAIVVVPRIKKPSIEDVYVYDSDGRQWRSKRSLRKHLDTVFLSEECRCEGCVRRNVYFAADALL